jgi:hypothetical protein
MKRRIFHWSSLGLLYKLYDETNYLTTSIEKHDWTNAVRDRRLADFLRRLTPLAMEFLVQDSPNEDWTAKDYLRVLCSNERLTSFKIYGQDSAMAFHHFLLAILIGYARALLRLKTAIEAAERVSSQHRKSRKMGDRKGSPTAGLDLEVSYRVGIVTVFAHALTFIAHSRALEEHLQVLFRRTLLPPMICYKDDYIKWATSWIHLPKDDEGQGKHDVDNAADDKAADVVDRAASDIGKVGEEDEEGEEYTEATRTAPTVTNCTTFRKWIMAFVGHFSAQHILEKHVGALPPSEEVHLDLLTMPRPKVEIGSWVYMENLIKDITKRHDSATYKMTSMTYIGKIKKHLLAYHEADSNHHTAEQDKIFPIFNALMNQWNDLGAPPSELQVNFPGNKHCEAILAAFLAYCDVATLEEKNFDPKLKELCKVLNPFTLKFKFMTLTCCAETAVS